MICGANGNEMGEVSGGSTVGIVASTNEMGRSGVGASGVKFGRISSAGMM